MIARIVAILAVVSAATGLVMLKTGKVEKLEREKGIAQQAIIMKERETAQARQLAAEAEMAKEMMAEERRIAYEALSEVQKKFKDSQNQVNDLLKRVRETANEDPELQAWGDRFHPESIVSLYNAAISDTFTGPADSGHEVPESSTP